ncbi:SGNH/GDSL hydrolase family protein [Niallia oryzisoli]|uniref:SGNH/GDSL hydrolase family protein n=1 Tax=Niallia oryzisoli TaxID=1737571 RepID=A0ABZ2CG05_9BACI
MKRIIPILLIIVCVATLYFGQANWNKKTAISTTTAAVKEGQPNVHDAHPSVWETLLPNTKNWPVESTNTFQASIQKEKPFKIVFLGSDSLGNGKDSWPEIVTTALKETFHDYINVNTLQYDLTSSEYVKQNLQSELIKEQPDLIIFEPFTLNDNGVVKIEDSLDNLSTIIQDVQADNPKAVFILQPPHPLYNATFYPKQVELLKDYAKDHGIVYLDHWEVWPDSESIEIKEYLVEDQTQPSVKGHELWAGYLVDYLVGGD